MRTKTQWEARPKDPPRRPKSKKFPKKEVQVKVIYSKTQICCRIQICRRIQLYRKIQFSSRMALANEDKLGSRPFWSSQHYLARKFAAEYKSATEYRSAAEYSSLAEWLQQIKINWAQDPFDPINIIWPTKAQILLYKKDRRENWYKEAQWKETRNDRKCQQQESREGKKSQTKGKWQT